MVEASAAGAEGPWDDATGDALRAVARQHAGTAWALQPVVVAMVHAVLAVRFGTPVNRPEFWHGMAQRIAAALWGDPRSQERLQTLWKHLTEAGR